MSKLMSIRQRVNNYSILKDFLVQKYGHLYKTSPRYRVMTHGIAQNGSEYDIDKGCWDKL